MFPVLAFSYFEGVQSYDNPELLRYLMVFDTMFRKFPPKNGNYTIMGGYDFMGAIMGKTTIFVRATHPAAQNLKRCYITTQSVTGTR